MHHISRPTYTGQLLSCNFVVRQKLQVALNFSTCNFYHATSDKVVLFSYTLLVWEGIHPIMQNRRQIHYWCFQCNSAYLDLMREYRRRNNCTEWTRKWVRHQPRVRVYYPPAGTGIAFQPWSKVQALYVWMWPLSMNCWPWRRQHPLIICTTSCMKLEVILFCVICWVGLVTVRLFDIHEAAFVTQQGHTTKVAPCTLSLILQILSWTHILLFII